MIYLGVEYGCKYVLERANGARVVFNDSTDADYVGTLSPESSGLDSPELREDTAEKVENDGAIFGDFFAGKRPVILQGEINATDPVDRNTKVAKLKRATNAKTDDATLYWEPKGSGTKVFVNLRRGGGGLRITKGYLKEFQASMIAADSRILSNALQSVSDVGISTTSQEKFPTVTGELVEPGLISAAWVNTNNIKLSDNVYATQTHSGGFTPEPVDVLFGKTYGFTLPTTAVVSGVEVKVEHKAAEVGVIVPENVILNRDIANRETVQGALFGEEGGEFAGGWKREPSDFAAEALTTSDVIKTYGSSLDKWRYYKWLTPAVINSATFGAGIQYGVFALNKPISVDAISIKVTYVEPMEVTATNEGDTKAPAVIKVTGPIENFYVLNQTTGETLSYTGALAKGRTLTFDTEAVTVFETGTGITEPINRFANVTFPNDWIQIAPGANKILVAGVGGNGTETALKVEYRYAWE